jgi:hypothetical protein
MSELIELSGSELSSVLIDAFAARAELVSPAAVMRSWLNDRFVQPCATSPRSFLLLDSAAFAAVESFEAIELSPICPLATNTSVAPMSQKKVLSTIRSTEVVADSTNVMALLCAVRRRKLLADNPKDSTTVKLCSSHRLVRVQTFNFPGAMAHFRVFALCSAGRDRGGGSFEAEAMAEHIASLFRIFDHLNEKVAEIRDVKIDLYGEDEVLRKRVSEAILRAVPALKLENAGKRKGNYYPTTSFKLKATNAKGEEHELADGGLTDWTQKLVGSVKERLMISGLGSDRTIQKFFRREFGGEP